MAVAYVHVYTVYTLHYRKKHAHTLTVYAFGLVPKETNYTRKNASTHSGSDIKEEACPTFISGSLCPSKSR